MAALAAATTAGGVDVISRVDEEMRLEMVEAQSQIAQWVTQQKATADSLALRGQRTLEADKENLDRLHEEQQAIIAAGGALQQRAHEERLRVEEVRDQLEKMTAQESKMAPEQQRLTQQLAHCRSLVVQREAGCEQTQASKEQKLAELDKGCTLYRTRLGLAFERVGEERLRLTFTSIDPADPLRAFSFQVFVDGGDKYHVESCSPPLASLASLVDTLNANNDFSAFVRNVRKGFKTLV